MQVISANASTKEPDFATYTDVSVDASQVTFVSLASDSAALGEHFAVAGDNPATPRVMAALDVTDVEIFGELTPEVERAADQLADLLFAYLETLGQRSAVVSASMRASVSVWFARWSVWSGSLLRT